MTIVKVQVAIVPRGAPALIYDQRREKVTQQVLTRGTMKHMGHDLKGYFEALWETGQWKIGKRVANEDW
jgi:hypothetical protein